jgi:hypothetical protein
VRCATGVDTEFGIFEGISCATGKRGNCGRVILKAYQCIFEGNQLCDFIDMECSLPIQN